MTVHDSQEPTVETLSRVLGDIATESWRFGKAIESLLSKLDAGEQDRFRPRFLWFQRKIDESLDAVRMRVVNVEGQPYDPGMAATPLNMDEFQPEDRLEVDQMLEPILMGPEGIIKTGTVTLRKAQS